MPIIYLSPSTQEWNQYVTGSGSEEYNMNRLADALVPLMAPHWVASPLAIVTPSGNRMMPFTPLMVA